MKGPSDLRAFASARPARRSCPWRRPAEGRAGPRENPAAQGRQENEGWGFPERASPVPPTHSVLGGVGFDQHLPAGQAFRTLTGALPWTAVLLVPTGLFPGCPWAFPGSAPFSSSSPDTFLGQVCFSPVPLLRADSGHHPGDPGEAPGARRLCCPHRAAPPAFGPITLLSDHPHSIHPGPEPHRLPSEGPQPPPLPQEAGPPLTRHLILAPLHVLPNAIPNSFWREKRKKGGRSQELGWTSRVLFGVSQPLQSIWLPRSHTSTPFFILWPFAFLSSQS